MNVAAWTVCCCIQKWAFPLYEISLRLTINSWLNFFFFLNKDVPKKRITLKKSCYRTFVFFFSSLRPLPLDALLTLTWSQGFLLIIFNLHKLNSVLSFFQRSWWHRSGPPCSSLRYLTWDQVNPHCPPWCCHCGPNTPLLCSYFAVWLWWPLAPGPLHTGSESAQSAPAGWVSLTLSHQAARKWCEIYGFACAGSLLRQRLSQSCPCGGRCVCWPTWRAETSGCTPAGTGVKRIHQKWTARKVQTFNQWLIKACASLTGGWLYLTLVLHFLCRPSNYVDMGRRNANRAVNRDVLRGAICCKDSHVSLSRKRKAYFFQALQNYRSITTHAKRFFPFYLTEKWFEKVGFVSERVVNQSIAKGNNTVRKVMLREPGYNSMLLHVRTPRHIHNHIAQVLPISAVKQKIRNQSAATKGIVFEQIIHWPYPIFLC